MHVSSILKLCNHEMLNSGITWKCTQLTSLKYLLNQYMYPYSFISVPISRFNTLIGDIILHLSEK